MTHTREDDIKIAKYIFGMGVIPATGVDYVFDQPPPWKTLPNFSTDYNATFDLLQELRKKWFVDLIENRTISGWTAKATSRADRLRVVSVRGETLTSSISALALEIIEQDKKEKK